MLSWYESNMQVVYELRLAMLDIRRMEGGMLQDVHGLAARLLPEWVEL